MRKPDGKRLLTSGYGRLRCPSALPPESESQTLELGMTLPPLLLLHCTESAVESDPSCPSLNSQHSNIMCIVGGGLRA